MISSSIILFGSCLCSPASCKQFYPECILLKITKASLVCLRLFVTVFTSYYSVCLACCTSGACKRALPSRQKGGNTKSIVPAINFARLARHVWSKWPWMSVVWVLSSQLCTFTAFSRFLFQATVYLMIKAS